MRRATVLFLVVVGCGASDPSLPAPVRVDPTSTARMPPAEPLADETSASPHGYADSTLTPFADRITALALAALAGDELPAVGVPVEPLREGQRLVELQGDLHAVPEGLEVVGFGLELDLVLDDSGGGERLHLVLYLSPTGIRLAYVSVTAGRRSQPLPRELDDLEQVASHVLAVLRAGNADALLLGEAERDWLNHEGLYDELVREAPDPETMRRAAELARGSGDPLGYRLDDVGLLLRAPDGSWFGAELDFEQRSDGVVLLENGPLITLRPLVPG